MSEDTKMTGDEIMAALYAEQGYAIVARSRAARIGDIVKENANPLGAGLTPLRITAVAARSKYIAQQQLGDRLAGFAVRDDYDIPVWAKFFYYVEAVD